MACLAGYFVNSQNIEVIRTGYIYDRADAGIIQDSVGSL